MNKVFRIDWHELIEHDNLLGELLEKELTSESTVGQPIVEGRLALPDLAFDRDPARMHDISKIEVNEDDEYDLGFDLKPNDLPIDDLSDSEIYLKDDKVMAKQSDP